MGKGTSTYLTLSPSGVETFVIKAIRNGLSDYTFQIRQLNLGISNEEVDVLKEKIVQQRKKKMAKKKKLQACTYHPIYDEKVFGTSKIDDTGKEINIGFHGSQSIVSIPGGLEGKSLIQFETDAPAEVVVKIRSMGCGPLLAVVTTSCIDTTKDLGIIFKNEYSVDESMTALSAFIGEVNSGNYLQNFTTALDLWAEHAGTVWFSSKDVERYLRANPRRKRPREDTDTSETSEMATLFDDLTLKLRGESQIKYRLSCLRSFTKNYKYKREELITHLPGQLIPDMKLSDGETKKFVVDLKNYDFELVVLIHSETVTVAIALNPYKYVGARSYCSGNIPPDIISPYITGELSKTVIRLRPSMASLMYDLCGVGIGDVVIDPCAGIGTIPVEGSFKRSFALGGDLALSGDGGLDHIAFSYYKNARDYQNVDGRSGSLDLASWDAALLPLRDMSADCIISDLPFGVRCMSSNKLKAFLPLLFSECARVLRPISGRMALLCGSYQGILEALQQGDEGIPTFEKPTSIIPVNIGGLSAWVILVKRSGSAATPLMNRKQRLVKILRGRSQRIAGGNKRVQS